jgi:TIR domain
MDWKIWSDRRHKLRRKRTFYADSRRAGIFGEAASLGLCCRHNLVLEMQRAAEEALKTIAVLSPAYLKSAFAAPEWAARFAEDPKGSGRSLVPVRVRECEAKVLLKAIVYIDLVGLEETEARQQLLDGLRGRRGKPLKKPLFPGGGRPRIRMRTLRFPAPPRPLLARRRNQPGTYRKSAGLRPISIREDSFRAGSTQLCDISRAP